VTLLPRSLATPAISEQALVRQSARSRVSPVRPVPSHLPIPARRPEFKGAGSAAVANSDRGVDSSHRALEDQNVSVLDLTNYHVQQVIDMSSSPCRVAASSASTQG
jgi:hypothetical protein